MGTPEFAVASLDAFVIAVCNIVAVITAPDKPFQVFGHPLLPNNPYSFTPNPTEGPKNSKLYG
jgi:hypothetical protein